MAAKAKTASRSTKPVVTAAKKKAAKAPTSKKLSLQTKTQSGPKSSAASTSKLGESVDDFVLEGTHGSFRLSDLKGQVVVLYFYPRDNTPGCTQEGQEFSELKDKFKRANASVFGISRDSLKSHHGFKAKQNYSVDLLSDEEEAACSVFDVVKDKNMYGKKVRGIERSTFVIDEEGNLAKEWRKVKVEGHAQEVLDFVKQLK